MMGMSDIVAAQTLVRELQLPLEPEEVRQKIKAGTSEKFPFATLMPGENTRQLTRACSSGSIITLFRSY